LQDSEGNKAQKQQPIRSREFFEVQENVRFIIKRFLLMFVSTRPDGKFCKWDFVEGKRMKRSSSSLTEFYLVG
jgi:hypothetical protein